MQSNWYPSLEYVRDLVKGKLAIEKIDGNLSTFKYSRKVHFDNLWDEIPYMKEIRGIVYDNHTGELVQAAPQKSFNYLENGCWKDVPLSTPVNAYKKYNGFMACATRYIGGEIVVSTTGTTNSDYAKLAKEEIMKLPNLNEEIDTYVTNLYEIIHTSDPHIIQEDREGAVCLGWRYHDDGQFIQNGQTQVLSATLGYVLEKIKSVKHEGFMLYTPSGSCCKLKSPYYLGKKFIMRSNKKLVDLMYNQSSGFSYCNNLDARWVSVVRLITHDIAKEDWLQLTDQGRRAIIEVYEKEYW